MPAIDIGNGSKNGDDDFGIPAFNKTMIDRNNPANNDGYLHTISFWSPSPMKGFRVGTFYLTGVDIYKCRDSALLYDTVIGHPAAPINMNVNRNRDYALKLLNIVVRTGDFLGFYSAVGYLDYNWEGGTALMQFNGESIDPDDENSFGCVLGNCAWYEAQSLGAVGDEKFLTDYTPNILNLSRSIPAICISF